uniref:Uncharacterized protein n=1 Tax=Cucumis melo TaxID=3656 RepID=A0A9I9EDP5_CUCME
MKLAGGCPSIADQLNVDAFLEQARSYDKASSSPIGWYIRNAQTRQLSHPLPVLRAREIDDWSKVYVTMTLITVNHQNDCVTMEENQYCFVYGMMDYTCITFFRGSMSSKRPIQWTVYEKLSIIDDYVLNFLFGGFLDIRVIAQQSSVISLHEAAFSEFTSTQSLSTDKKCSFARIIGVAKCETQDETPDTNSTAALPCGTKKCFEFMYLTFPRIAHCISGEKKGVGAESSRIPSSELSRKSGPYSNPPLTTKLSAPIKSTKYVLVEGKILMANRLVLNHLIGSEFQGLQTLDLPSCPDKRHGPPMAPSHNAG